MLNSLEAYTNDPPYITLIQRLQNSDWLFQRSLLHQYETVMLNIHPFTYLYNIFFNLSISINAFDQPEEPRVGQMWKTSTERSHQWLDGEMVVYSGAWGCIPCSAIPHPQCVSLSCDPGSVSLMNAAHLPSWTAETLSARPPLPQVMATVLHHWHVITQTLQSIIVKEHTDGLIYLFFV